MCKENTERELSIAPHTSTHPLATRAFVGEQDTRAFEGEQDTRAVVGEQDTRAFVGEQDTRAFVGEQDMRAVVGEQDTRGIVKDQAVPIMHNARTAQEQSSYVVGVFARGVL